MLDTLQYVKNSDGSFTKTIVSVSTITNVALEVEALQAQVANFQLSQETGPSDDIAAAITNYEAQLSVLGGD